MTKVFIEERTGKVYMTLAAAKKSSPGARVYRVWLDDNSKVLGRILVWAFGEAVCKIRIADAVIETRLKY